MVLNGKTEKRRTGAAVLVVDDHPIVRQGVTLLVDAQDDMYVCGEAVDADQAIEQIQRLRPRLAIVDLSLGGKPGIELIKDIRSRFPDVRVLVLSMHDETMYAERCIRAGAVGYVMKQEATERIVTAVRRVLTGQIYVSERIASNLLQQWAGSGSRKGKSAMDTLSDRELEVFQMIGQGKTVRDIAAALHLSPKTIEAHREHIKEKLRLPSSVELLRYAISAGLGGSRDKT